jgi:hypothetical protein
VILKQSETNEQKNIEKVLPLQRNPDELGHSSRSASSLDEGIAAIPKLFETKKTN